MLTLYYHPLSSYCWKALVALYENGTPFDKKIVDLGDAAERADLAARWPIVKFPVLYDASRDRNISETSILIEYLDAYYPGAYALIPSEFEAGLEVRLWDRIFDQYVSGPMQAIVADRIRGSKGDTSGERAMLDKAYGMIEQRMTGREWVAGGFSLADCAAAPALFYASTLHPFPTGATNLDGYLERLVARLSFARVLEEARPFFAMYPFKEKLPERYRVP